MKVRITIEGGRIGGLKRLLKVLWRSFGWRCTKLEELDHE